MNTSIWEKVQEAKAEVRGGQAHRLVDYLYSCGPTLSGELCQECAISNLSQAANQIRPALEKRGLAIVSKLPKPLVKNRFGQSSMSHEWRLRVLL